MLGWRRRPPQWAAAPPPRCARPRGMPLFACDCLARDIPMGTSPFACWELCCRSRAEPIFVVGKTFVHASFPVCFPQCFPQVHAFSHSILLSMARSVQVIVGCFEKLWFHGKLHHGRSGVRNESKQCKSDEHDHVWYMYSRYWAVSKRHPQ